jgi:hypothetical protein
MKVLPTHPPVKQESGREAWLLLLAFGQAGLEEFVVDQESKPFLSFCGKEA